MPDWSSKLIKWVISLIISIIEQNGANAQAAKSRAVVKQEIKDAQELRERVEADYAAASPDDKQRMRNKWLATGSDKPDA